jgi:phosphoglycerate dehydrogenase-like enzyme
MKPRVLVVMPEIGEQVAGRLATAVPQAEIVWAPTDEHGQERYADAEVYMGLGLGFGSRTLARMPHLKWIQCLVSGTDHLRPVLRGRDLILTSASGIHGPQMAEVALLHMLSLSRDARRLHRDQDAHVWEPRTPRVLDGRTVTIVGVGTIAQRLAPLCKALGMTVLGVSRAPRDVEGFDRVYDRADLVEASAAADFLVVLVPYSSATDRIIGADVLGALKPAAFVINLARGGVVDEEALVSAVQDGRIGGAGLDVFATEPLPATSPLWDLENVLVTPHCGGRSDRYGEQLLTVIEPNLSNYVAGRHDRLINRVVLADDETESGST